MSIIKQIEVGGVKIEVISLFDLGCGFSDYASVVDYYKGYVISEKGHVYSDKRFGKFMRIGYMSSDARARVTIAGQTFYVDDLHKKAIPLFKKAKAKASKASTSKARPGVFKKFVVSAVDNDVLKFASTPKLHDSRKSAEDEASRLAKEHSGMRFAVCEVVSTVVAGAVTWEK